jgi:hypothetical protein
MQMGAYEALSLEKPIITSDWQILRESFGKGAVYVKNTPESICYGIHEMFNNYDEYKKNVLFQREKRRTYFYSTRKSILSEIDRLHKIVVTQ